MNCLGWTAPDRSCLGLECKSTVDSRTCSLTAGIRRRSVRRADELRVTVAATLVRESFGVRLSIPTETGPVGPRDCRL